MNEVSWDEAALEELADLWVAVSREEREQMEAAIVRLNDRLKLDPNNEGESRSGSVRVTIAKPLTVWFRVYSDIDSVVVFHIVRPIRRN